VDSKEGKVKIMASKRGESTGSVSRGVKDGKVGKLKQEGQQNKSVAEDKAGRKGFKDLEERLEKEVGELREEVKAFKEYVE